jgi:hypothetical protein
VGLIFEIYPLYENQNQNPNSGKMTGHCIETHMCTTARRRYMCNVAMVQSVFVRQQTCSLLKRLGARMLVSAVASYRVAANRRARMGEAGEMAAADWPAEVTRTREVCIYRTNKGEPN